MAVCVEPDLGLFVRINSEDWPIGSLAIAKADHPFLKRDSFLGCGQPFELDDHTIQRAIETEGIKGRVTASLAQSICLAIRGSATISRADKNDICAALGC